MAKEYNEVVEILNHISKDDLNKIPIDMYNMFKANRDIDYRFIYDTNKTLEEQNVSKEAKTIIAILYRDYWATEKQREKILEKERQDRKEMEQENRAKYNPDNIFRNKMKTIDNVNETDLIETEKSIFGKIINFIKRIFHK